MKSSEIVDSSDRENVGRNIANSKAFIGLVTENYINDAKARAELEYAQSLGKPIILLVKTDIEIPDDIGHYDHVIFWEKIEDVTESLKKVLRGVYNIE